MSDTVIADVLLAVSALLVASHLFGYVFIRLRQPRLVGEILAGILLGPFVLGRLWPEGHAALFGAGSTGPVSTVLGFITHQLFRTRELWLALAVLEAVYLQLRWAMLAERARPGLRGFASAARLPAAERKVEGHV